MSKIIVLDKFLSNQIRAWEVVERPYSVVKELVENSIDAFATNIIVEIQKWWKTYISITDDWEWISKDDLEICIDKYTTSKIKNIDDLYNVMTFWFRWEALASISSVSRFSIITATVWNDWYKLEYDNISWKKIIKTTSNIWTKIIVKDLFFNTPARLNYLKTDKTEYQKILQYLYSISLSYPDIWFEFISDDKKIFKFNANEDLKTRIFSIYWSDFYDNLEEINFALNGIVVSGYITNPKIHFLNKTRQNLFVNKRPISSVIISKAIFDAYNRFVPHHTYAWYVLNISINPTLIDVNVHPRKQEIRFENEQNIFRATYHAILNKLENISLTKEDNTFLQNNENIIWNNNTPKNEYYTWSWDKFKSYSPYTDKNSSPNQINIKDTIDFTKILLWDVKNFQNNFEEEDYDKEYNSNDLTQTKLWKIIWQVFNSYIIIQDNTKILILDQHALAERVIYEKLVKKDSKSFSQQLLLPVYINLSTKEFEIITDYKEIFYDMWFEYDVLSNWNISIISIPDFVKKENIKELFSLIIWDLLSWNTIKSNSLQEVKNKIFAYTSCRSAIKFWHKLELFEMNKLLNDASLDYSLTCPHWRPVIYEILLHDLKTKFDR